MTMEEASAKAKELNEQAKRDRKPGDPELEYRARYFNDGTWYVRGYKGFRGPTFIAAK